MTSRNLEIYRLHLEGISQREIAEMYDISIPRVSQIITTVGRFTSYSKLYQDDPLFQALEAGKISTRLYNTLLRSGYNREFDLAWLREQLKAGEFEIKGIGEKGVALLREVVL